MSREQDARAELLYYAELLLTAWGFVKKYKSPEEFKQRAEAVSEAMRGLERAVVTLRQQGKEQKNE